MTTPFTNDELDRLVALAVEAASAGSDVVRAHFGQARDVRSKAPGDWVSAADVASERAVREVLLAGAPDLPVFGEEEGGARADVGWLVDPLDGTANFLHEFDAVGVSIGLVADGVPIVGVVDAPFLSRVYAARTGGGATRNGAPVVVSDRSPSAAICAFGLPFRRKELLPVHMPVMMAALDAVEDLRRVGAASLDLCWTAQGTFDGYFELALGPWDVAAGAVIVREAGGVVTDWSGDDRAWLHSGDIVAASPAVHATILGLIAGAGSSGGSAGG